MAARAPLCPPHCSVRHLPKAMLDVDYLRDGPIALLQDDAAYRAAVNLLWSSIKAEPAASLPNEDRALARAAGLGANLKKWMKVKEEALGEWVECSDGRIYHTKTAEAVLEAYIGTLKHRISGRRGNETKWQTPSASDDLGPLLEEAKAALKALNPASSMLTRSGPSQRDRAAIALASQENRTEPNEPNEKEGAATPNGAPPWDIPPQAKYLAQSMKITMAQVSYSAGRYRDSCATKGREPNDKDFMRWLAEEHPKPKKFGHPDLGWI